MIAAGAFTGEAFYGVEAAILAVLDEQIGSMDNWPIVRFSGFIILNAVLGAMIYVLFRKAGILGQGGSGGDTSNEVLDAELAA
jgi:hypothetical protein